MDVLVVVSSHEKQHRVKPTEASNDGMEYDQVSTLNDPETRINMELKGLDSS